MSGVTEWRYVTGKDGNLQEGDEIIGMVKTWTVLPGSPVIGMPIANQIREGKLVRRAVTPSLDTLKT